MTEMMEELNRSNLHRTCRLCLEKMSEACPLYPIYENVKTTGRSLGGFNESIPEIISTCVGIKVRLCFRFVICFVNGKFLRNILWLDLMVTGFVIEEKLSI